MIRPEPSYPPVRPNRFFFTFASIIFIGLNFWGFHNFYLRGHGVVDQPLNPKLLLLLWVHGTALTGWIVLFFAQSCLVASRHVAWHRWLGWSTAGLVPVIVVGSLWLGISAARLNPRFAIGGIPYPRFLLVMFAEIATFALLAGLAIIFRKRKAVHGVLMCLATMELLPPATSRTHFFQEVFGGQGSFAAPMFLVGVVLFLLRWYLERKADWLLAVGVAAISGSYVLAFHLAMSDAWRPVAERIVSIK